MKINSVIFLENSEHFPELFKKGFVRNHDGLMEAKDWLLSSKSAIHRSLLGAVPVLGSILGFSRIYSVWYTSDNDWKKQVVWHTVFGVLEFLGLGILALALKIILTVTHFFLILLSEILFIIIDCFSSLVPTYNI